MLKKPHSWERNSVRNKIGKLVFTQKNFAGTRRRTLPKSHMYATEFPNTPIKEKIMPTFSSSPVRNSSFKLVRSLGNLDSVSLKHEPAKCSPKSINESNFQRRVAFTRSFSHAPSVASRPSNLYNAEGRLTRIRKISDAAYSSGYPSTRKLHHDCSSEDINNIRRRYAFDHKRTVSVGHCSDFAYSGSSSRQSFRSSREIDFGHGSRAHGSFRTSKSNNKLCFSERYELEQPETLPEEINYIMEEQPLNQSCPLEIQTPLFWHECNAAGAQEALKYSQSRYSSNSTFKNSNYIDRTQSPVRYRAPPTASVTRPKSAIISIKLAANDFGTKVSSYRNSVMDSSSSSGKAYRSTEGVTKTPCSISEHAMNFKNRKITPVTASFLSTVHGWHGKLSSARSKPKKTKKDVVVFCKSREVRSESISVDVCLKVTPHSISQEYLLSKTPTVDSFPSESDATEPVNIVSNYLPLTSHSENNNTMKEYKSKLIEDAKNDIDIFEQIYLICGITQTKREENNINCGVTDCQEVKKSETSAMSVGHVKFYLGDFPFTKPRVNHGFKKYISPGKNSNKNTCQGYDENVCHRYSTSETLMDTCKEFKNKVETWYQAGTMSANIKRSLNFSSLFTSPAKSQKDFNCSSSKQLSRGQDMTYSKEYLSQFLRKSSNSKSGHRRKNRNRRTFPFQISEMNVDKLFSMDPLNESFADSLITGLYSSDKSHFESLKTSHGYSKLKTSESAGNLRDYNTETKSVATKPQDVHNSETSPAQNTPVRNHLMSTSSSGTAHRYTAIRSSEHRYTALNTSPEQCTDTPVTGSEMARSQRPRQCWLGGDRVTSFGAVGDRATGDRDSNDRASGDRASGDRSSAQAIGDRVTSDRGNTDRDSGDRVFVERVTVPDQYDSGFCDDLVSFPECDIEPGHSNDVFLIGSGESSTCDVRFGGNCDGDVVTENGLFVPNAQVSVNEFENYCSDIKFGPKTVQKNPQTPYVRKDIHQESYFDTLIKESLKKSPLDNPTIKHQTDNELTTKSQKGSPKCNKLNLASCPNEKLRKPVARELLPGPSKNPYRELSFPLDDFDLRPKSTLLTIGEDFLRDCSSQCRKVLSSIGKPSPGETSTDQTKLVSSPTNYFRNLNPKDRQEDTTSDFIFRSGTSELRKINLRKYSNPLFDLHEESPNVSLNRNLESDIGSLNFNKHI